LSQVLALKNLLSVMFEYKYVHLLILATKKFKICITQEINGDFLRYHTWSDNKVRKLDIRGTVNQVYYLEVLKRLREKVRRKQPKLYANNSWILHRNNAPAHTALSVREFLATKQITVFEHPAYSPDLAPNGFFCSQR